MRVSFIVVLLGGCLSLVALILVLPPCSADPEAPPAGDRRSAKALERSSGGEGGGRTGGRQTRDRDGGRVKSRRNPKNPKNKSKRRKDKKWPKQKSTSDYPDIFSAEAENGAITSPSPPDMRTEPGNCSVCMFREEARLRRLDHIKKQILSQLGLEEPPNITVNLTELPNSPEFVNLLSEFDKQDEQPQMDTAPTHYDNYDDSRAVQTTHIFVGCSEGPHFGTNSEYLYFELPSNLTNMELLAAHLHMFFLPMAQGSFDKRLMMLVYRLDPRDSSPSDFARSLEFQEELQVNDSVDVTNGHWRSVNINKLVSRWIRNPSTNYGLYVQAFDERGTSLIARCSSQPHERPYLKLEVKEKTVGRTKRYEEYSRVCKDESTEVMCCMFDLEVDFEELRWDWIIVPKRFNVRFCAGLCPYVLLQKFPHTHIIQQTKPRYIEGGPVGPCCTPKSMSSMQLIWTDSMQITKVGYLTGMKVQSCGCS